jgi:hypothetical protein
MGWHAVSAGVGEWRRTSSGQHREGAMGISVGSGLVGRVRPLLPGYGISVSAGVREWRETPAGQHPAGGGMGREKKGAKIVVVMLSCG